MSKMDKLSSYCTTITTRADGKTVVTYHSTAIVKFDGEEVTLQTGGWDTVTTRRKMNQASRQFGLGYLVYRKDGESYVSLPSGETVPLARETTFARY